MFSVHAFLWVYIVLASTTLLSYIITGISAGKADATSSLTTVLVAFMLFWAITLL